MRLRNHKMAALVILAITIAGLAATLQLSGSRNPTSWQHHVVNISRHPISLGNETWGFHDENYIQSAPLVTGVLMDSTVLFLLFGALAISLATIYLNKTGRIKVQRHSPSTFLGYASLALLLFALDAITKSIAVAHAGSGRMSWSPILGQPMQTVGTVLCLSIIAVAAFAGGGRAVWIALSCVLAGALGSLYSSICYHGYVPDFITINSGGSFITVNTSDIAVAAGLLIALFALVRKLFVARGPVPLATTPARY